MPCRDLSRRGFLALGAAIPLVSTRALAGEATTFSNATLVLEDGSTARGGIRFRDGIIEAVGPKVVGGTDLDGHWLVPGLTDAGCRLGLLEVGMERDTHDSSAKENQALDARVVDGYNPRSDLIPVARVNGITQAVVNPEASGMIPGQAALLRTAGDRLGDVILKAPVGLCMNLGRAGQGHDGPESRIGLMSAWRKFFEEHPERKGKASKKKDDKKEEDRIIDDLRSGKLLAMVRAHRADDIERAIALIKDNALNAVLVGCIEGHLLADVIAAEELPVLLGPLDAQPSSFQNPHAIYENAAILNEAGVKLAFRTGDAHNVRNLPTLAGLAVAHGLPHEAAMRALTSSPMDIFGMPKLGRLTVGSEATFFVVEGDPLQPKYPVSSVYIRGQLTDMQTRQTRLYEEFRELW